jgi:hypothetical protein
MSSRVKKSISKESFIKAYQDFLFQNGVTINDRSPDLSQAWEFFRLHNDFIVSLTAASGRIDLWGVGRFEFMIGGRGLGSTPKFKYYASRRRYLDFFKSNPDLVDTEGNNNPEELYSCAMDILNQLNMKKNKDCEDGDLR